MKESCDEDIFISLALFGSARYLDAIDILSRIDLTSHTFCWAVTSSSICVSRLSLTIKLTVAKSKSTLTVTLTSRNVKTWTSPDLVSMLYACPWWIMEDFYHFILGFGVYKCFIWMMIRIKGSKKPHFEHSLLLSIPRSFAFLFNTANVDYRPCRRGRVAQRLRAVSGARLLGFEFRFCFLCLWSWTHCLTSLCLRVLLRKMKVIVVLTFQHVEY